VFYNRAVSRAGDGDASRGSKRVREVSVVLGTEVRASGLAGSRLCFHLALVLWEALLCS